MVDAPQNGGLDLREQITRIDQLLADAARKRQEISYASRQMLFAGVFGDLAAGAGLFAVALAWLRTIGH